MLISHLRTEKKQRDVKVTIKKGAIMKKRKPQVVLPLEECERRTGRKISTWRREIADRKIPYVKIGRSVRIPEEFIEDLIQKGWRDPAKTPEV